MLSILIPTYQRTDLLGRCLASVVQHAPAGTEIVVVDVASPRGEAAGMVRNFPGVKLVRRQHRGGFAKAANTGIQASSGAILQLLNDDAVVTAGWAEAAWRRFADPTVAAVAPLVLMWPDGRRIDSAGDRYYLGGVASKRGHGQLFGPAYAQACLVFGASASSAFYRRSALDAVGLFPELFGSYFEDVDLSFRLQRAGYAILYEPASRVLHQGGASHGAAKHGRAAHDVNRNARGERPRLPRQLLERQSCNEERVFWRNLPDLWGTLPRHLAVLAGKACRRWNERTLTPWIFGRLRLLTEILSLRRHRQLLRQRYPAGQPALRHVSTHFRNDAEISCPGGG